MKRSGDIVFLLGAGASADLGIPTLKRMEEDIENLLQNDDDWKKYYSLYHLIKASYNYSYEIQGKIPNFNLEILLNILQELLKKEEHPIYPFIGSWVVKFDEVVKNDFSIIRNFEKQIRKKLYNWIKIDNERRQNLIYLKKFSEIRKEIIQFPLHIFTLNYDLGIELANRDARIERGFQIEENGLWNYRRFLELNPDEEPDIYLYKLHGSIDWERDEKTQKMTFTNGESENPALIFGTQYKMQYIDPFLFLFSEFRKKVFDAKLIICIGYSFYDEHINGVISDALRDDKNKKTVLSVSLNLKTEEILKRPNIADDIINQFEMVFDKSTKKFLETVLTKEYLNKYFENEEL